MRQLVLKPIRENRRDWDALQAKVIALFRAEIYLPLLKSIQVSGKALKNSDSALRAAIMSGKVRYSKGIFTGSFSSAVSRELRSLGAVWSRKLSGWSINESLLSQGIGEALRQINIKDDLLRAKLTDRLSLLSSDDITDKFSSEALFKDVTKDVESKFQESIKKITVAPKLSARTQQQISDEYSNNLKLAIKDFAEKELKSLRKNIETHVFAGDRYEGLVKQIQLSYQVSQRKAKILAERETKLLTSALRQARYQDVGIDDYFWQSNGGPNVRPRHKELTDESKKGKTFKFSDPPVSGTKGEHQNPGQPFGCNCIARPVVKF